MGDGVYTDCEITDYDVEHIDTCKIATYNKNRAEELIQLIENKTNKPLSEKKKESLREMHRYIGD